MKLLKDGRHKASNRGFVRTRKKSQDFPGEYRSAESFAAYEAFCTEWTAVRDLASVERISMLSLRAF